jgi:DNA-binding SARP family transcriptional activator
MEGNPIDFRVLGPVEAHAGGRVLDLGSGRQRCVLAALLVDSNHVLPADQLMSRVWDDKYPHRATFYSYVSRLRTVLGGVEGVELLRSSGGYHLTVDPLAVDLFRFRDQVGLARGTDDPERAASHLEHGLEQWRGEAFTDLDTQWLNELRAALEAERRAVELDRNDLMLRLGRHADLLPQLMASAAGYPLDERVAGQMMVALHRCGRADEALRVYQDIRAALVRNLGLEPGPQLRALHQWVLESGNA